MRDVQELRARQEESLVAVMTGMPELVPGLDHARLFLQDLASHVRQAGLRALIERAEDDSCRGFTCLLGDDGAGVNDICRDLMEIELLLADFHRDPSSLDRWTNLPVRQRSDAYKFGKVLDRVGRSSGVPSGLTHPMAGEYQAHSSSLHPTPEGRMGGESDDLSTRLVVWAADLFEHIWRVIEVLLALVSSRLELLEDDAIPGDWDLAPVVAARDSARQVTAWLTAALEDAGIEVGERAPFSRKDHPDAAMYRFTKPGSK